VIGDAVASEIGCPIRDPHEREFAPDPDLIRKIDGSNANRKYWGEGLVLAAAGPDCQTAMIHATITGLEKDEPADEGCRADLCRTEVSAGQ